MIDIKARLFSKEDNRMERVIEMRNYFNSDQWECDSVYDETGEESEWVSYQPVMLATGVTDNDDNDIYYGDVYRVAGYGALVVHNIVDVMTLLDAKCEKDLGAKLGDIYTNPELKDK